MKTLIITIGTRQVGWRCNDGIVRSLGADGVKYDPQHIAEIYKDELGLERGYHQDEGSDRTYPWSVWDLGQRLWQQCQKTGFSPVELLLDQVVITEQVNQGLNHILLWGTCQPDSVSWNYRRMDTAWLAELMAGKLQDVYPNVQVKVFKPVVEAIDVNAIRDELEFNILPFALQTRLPEDDQFTIVIENKGATPAIAEGLSICAGALVRDCQVITMTPIEPKPLYPKVSETVQAAAPATEYRSVNLSSYFWPLERSRILSAWERGDFAEAKVWLKAHRDRYQALYELAEHLSLAVNWQWQDALKALQGNNWLDLPTTKQCIPKSQRNQWRSAIQAQYQVNETPSSKFLKLWESRLLIHLNLIRQNYTAAFIQFVQTLERLLFWRYQTEDWIQQGYVMLPDDKKEWGVKKYKATFYDLRLGWQKQEDLSNDSPICQQLEAINELRNGVIHRSESLTFDELKQVVCPALAIESSEALYTQMEAFLQQFCSPESPMPDRSLLQELYNWGLQQLQSETGS